MMSAVAHATAAEECREHNSFVSGERFNLCLQLDEGLLLASQLTATSNVFELVFVCIVDLIELVRRLFLLVVQMLHCVYYLT